MFNELFITFDKKSSGLKTIKEEELSHFGNSSIEDEIKYMNELRYLIELKIKEINQESK